MSTSKTSQLRTVGHWPTLVSAFLYLEHPQTVRPFCRKNARLIERNPLLFFKIGFFVLFLINVVLLVLLMNRK